MHSRRDLGGGVWQFQSPLWQTNSVLAVAEGDSLLFDPAFFEPELDQIRRETKHRAAGRTYLAVTHADFDHVCGIGWFPEAEVVAGPATAETVASGEAADALRSAAAEWAVGWPDALRVDRILAAREATLGPFRVSTFSAANHGRDGTAYVLLEQGILLPGDHLSAMTYPLLGDSLARTREATARILEELGRHDLRWVVPGHGPALTPDQARGVGEADLDYMTRLARAARESRAAGLSPGHALLRVFEVAPPRTTTPDFEIYGLRAGNARLALAELDAQRQS